MNAEQHRRLLGNDVLFIIFHDHPDPFKPAPLDALGTVPQIFIVVQKYQDQYRMMCFSRPNIKPYEPVIPENFLFGEHNLKDFLLTKAYNGYCQALSCPPMNRLFEVPRAATISELVSKYPQESNVAQRRRQKGAKMQRQLIQQEIKDPLFLLVRVKKALPGEEILNSYVACK